MLGRLRRRGVQRVLRGVVGLALARWWADVDRERMISVTARTCVRHVAPMKQPSNNERSVRVDGGGLEIKPGRVLTSDAAPRPDWYILSRD